MIPVIIGIYNFPISDLLAVVSSNHLRHVAKQNIFIGRHRRALYGDFGVEASSYHDLKDRCPDAILKVDEIPGEYI